MDDKQFEFVAKHWRRGRFDARRAWKRLGIGPSLRWRRIRVAAAVAGAVALSTVAAVFYMHYTAPQVPEHVRIEQEMRALEAVMAIDFDNAPLPMVVEKIKDVYGVEVANVPVNADDYRLTLHYVGNAADLVDAINDILGTEMEVMQ